MKNLGYIALSITLISVLTSCFKNNGGDGECNPNTICYTQPPETLYVRIKLSESPDGSPVKVRVYVGDVDNGELFDSFTTTNDTETYLLPVNTDYSAEAEYSDGEITIIAVDGDRLNRRSFENCDVTCYDYDHSITLDLELD